jgi:hypothetical protein
MAKGNRCPSCGELTFHNSSTHKAVYHCSTCQTVGWWGNPGGPGSGKGSKCESCGGSTMRTVYKRSNVVVRFCSTCKTTLLAEQT